MHEEILPGQIPQALLDVETQKLETSLPKLHGHYFLQYSSVNQQILPSSSLSYDFFIGKDHGSGSVDMHFDQLPFRDNGLDCLLLHHVLDYESDPHQCLREAARAVVPNGYLILVAFNPWSAIGLSRILPGSLLPYKGRYIARRRVEDWLALLGFRVEQVEACQFLPPLILKRFPRLSKWFDAFMGYLGFRSGGVYILVARKLVAGRTPIRPQWRTLAGRAVSVNHSASKQAAE